MQALWIMFSLGSLAILGPVTWGLHRLRKRLGPGWHALLTLLLIASGSTVWLLLSEIITSNHIKAALLGVGAPALLLSISVELAVRYQHITTVRFLPVACVPILSVFSLPWMLIASCTAGVGCL